MAKQPAANSEARDAGLNYAHIDTYVSGVFQDRMLDFAGSIQVRPALATCTAGAHWRSHHMCHIRSFWKGVL